MHRKTFLPDGVKRLFPLLILLLFFVMLLGTLSASGTSGIEELYVNREGLSRFIIAKALPVLDASTYEGSGEDTTSDFAYAILKQITSVDFENPKTLLAAEIPMLDMFRSNTLNANAGAAFGSDLTAGGDDKKETVSNPEADRGKPALIIYHTHTRESFTPTAKYSYDMGKEDHRTSDKNFNVCRVGEEVKKYIESNYRLAVVHDTTVHDYPSYTGSYKRSKPTAQALIQKYPDAKLILDLHRDAFADDKAARKKMVLNINGEAAAKIMFVVGNGNPNWQENYQLAQKLTALINKQYPGIMRSIDSNNYFTTYNQELSNRSLIVEVGAECTTLEEVLASARILAKSIGDFIKSS